MSLDYPLQVQRLERSLRLLSACNRVLVRAKDEQQLLQTLCQCIIDEGGYRLVWVGFVHQDESKTVTPVAYAGEGVDYLATIQITWADTETGRGPAGNAIRSGQPCVVQDIQTDPNYAPWREAAQQRGYRALIALPLSKDGVVFGVLNLYGAEADLFPPEEVQILGNLADDLSYGLGALRAECDRQQAQQALEFQVKLDRLVASISNRFIQLSPQNTTESINQALREIGEFTQVNSSYIFQYSDNAPTHSMTHEWVAPGITPSLPNTQDLPLDVFPWATARLQRGEVVYVSSTQALPPEAAIDQQSFQRFGVMSSLTIPLIAHGQVKGLVGFASFQQEHHWSEDTVRLLKIFADILMNVLERQKVEVALKESQQRYASLAEAAPAGIFRTDINGRGIYHNDRWCQMTGLSPEAGLAMGWLSVLHPEDRDRVLTAWLHAVQNHLPFQQEYRFQRSDGQVIWVFGQAIPESSTSGEVSSYVGTLTDITEAKRTEAALRDSEERLRLALAAANQGLYDLNVQTGEAIVSAGYAIMLGYDPTILQETYAQWLERVHPEDRETVVNTYRAYMQGEISDYAVEFRQRTQTGGWKWILSLGKFVAWDHAGQPLRMLGTHTDITDRKEAELKLKTANQQITTIWESMTDAYISLDREWRIMYANPAAVQVMAQLKHLNPDAFLGKTHWEIFPELLGQDLEREYRRAVAEQVAVHLELLYEPTGQWFEIHGYPSAVGLGLYFRDISDRKQADAQRLQTEQIRRELKLLEQILDIVLAGYWDWDIPGNQEYCSPGFKRMFGYADHELPNRPGIWKHLIFPEDLPGVLECFDRHVQSRGEIPYYNEVRYRHKDGSTVWVICSGQVIEWDEVGHPLRMIGCHINITDRKQAEQELTRSRDLREAIFNELADALFLVDAQTLLTLDCNQRAVELFGASDRSELIDIEGHTLQRHQFTGQDLASISTEIWEKGFWSRELEYVTRQGNVFWGNIAAKPIVVAGRAMNLVRVTDISDRKRVEASIQHTARLLAATNQELESFSYSVSHDLRAPLRHMGGFVNALKQQLHQHQALNDPKVTHYLQVIEKSSQKMAQLIDGLLSLSRMGRRPMVWQPVPLRELVETAITLTQTEGGDHPSVEFVIGALPTLSGDATLLQQVFQNLIDNAVKFSRHTSAPRIEINSDSDGTIWIKDNGAGFQMEYADKLFGAFQRLHGQAEFEGTGIGLAIVQRIVQRHGGTIWAEAKPNQGATFFLRFGDGS